MVDQIDSSQYAVVMGEWNTGTVRVVEDEWYRVNEIEGKGTSEDDEKTNMKNLVWSVIRKHLMEILIIKENEIKVMNKRWRLLFRWVDGMWYVAMAVRFL